MRRERYGLREVDSFEKAIGIKPRPVQLPSRKYSEFWNSPAFQALLSQQEAVETEAELEARRAQLDALTKRVAREEKVPHAAVQELATQIARHGLPELPPGRRALRAQQATGVPAPLAAGVGVGSAEEIAEGHQSLGGLSQLVDALVDPPLARKSMRAILAGTDIGRPIQDAAREHDELVVRGTEQEKARAAADEHLALSSWQKHLKTARAVAYYAGHGALGVFTGGLSVPFQAALVAPDEDGPTLSSVLGGIASDVGAAASTLAAPALQDLRAIRDASRESSSSGSSGLPTVHVGDQRHHASHRGIVPGDTRNSVPEHRKRKLPLTNALEDLRSSGGSALVAAKHHFIGDVATREALGYASDPETGKAVRVDALRRAKQGARALVTGAAMLSGRTPMY